MPGREPNCLNGFFSFGNECRRRQLRCPIVELDSKTLRRWRWKPIDSGNNTVVVYISNAMPAFCVAYTGHQYTYDLAPKYVGTSEREGYWVDSKDYAAALETYDARIATEGAQNQINAGRKNYRWGNNQ